jgi:APA family basic amino acid/polyamine antiporter
MTIRQAEFGSADEGASCPEPQKNRLLRILGVGFGVAVVIGGTLGVGILRSPGAVAAHLGSGWLILLVWALGGLYTLLAANNTAELATMMPRAGGPYVYARRAYGDYGGFVVGWSDWMLNTLPLSFMTIVFGEYMASLFAPFPGNVQAFGVSILLLLTAINWVGLRAGSETQKAASVLKALALLAFVAACFLFGGQDKFADPPAVGEASKSTFATIVACVLSFQLVLSAFGGWNAVIYFAEEDTNPQRNIPRSLFGGIALIIVIYLLVNAALLYVLPMRVMAASKFAGADAINVIFGALSGRIVTALALLSIVGILNALLMFVPRVLLALGRDGLFWRKAATVNARGTPTVAMACTVAPAILMALVGSFEMLLAISEFFAVTIVILLIGALFILRWREPEAPRPYRAWGYPYAPALMLALAVALFVAYIVSNPVNSVYAIAFLVASYPVYRAVRRQGDATRGT